ncbi:MAG: hypothetical protein JWM16_2748 [Verrucomicrobiales bacterium]|nr:hypothetical protein [Verrucomicrobiales bacterium]
MLILTAFRNSGDGLIDIQTRSSADTPHKSKNPARGRAVGFCDGVFLVTGNDFAHLEDWQEHAYCYAADHNSKEDDQERLDQGGQA